VKKLLSSQGTYHAVSLKQELNSIQIANRALTGFLNAVSLFTIDLPFHTHPNNPAYDASLLVDDLKVTFQWSTNKLASFFFVWLKKLGVTSGSGLCRHDKCLWK